MGSVLVHSQLPLGRGKGLEGFIAWKLSDWKFKGPWRSTGASLFSVAVNVLCIFMAVKSTDWGWSEAEGLTWIHPLQ